MTMTDNIDDFGRASIDPAGQVVAGSFGTWRLTYQAGSQGIAVGGRLRVHTDADTDWGIPQFIDPTGPDYMTVEAPAGVQTSVRVGGPKSLNVVIGGRPLEPGERVTLTFGDRNGGSPGSRAQTFFEDRRFFWIDVDPDGNGNSVTLVDSPDISIVGGDAVRLVVVAPSELTVGEAFRVLVKAEDVWGNPSNSYRGSVDLHGEGVEAENSPITFRSDDSGSLWADGFRVCSTGVFRITATDSAAGLSAASNPIVVTETGDGPRLHWADPHGGQVVLNSKIADFFRYARDVSGVQFVGYQRNADCISVEDWEVQQQQERDFYEPGRFVPIPGFEWSGRTWQGGGHHNVYFRRHDQPVRRNPPAEVSQSVEESTELEHIRDVYAAYRHEDVIITPHVGGEHSDLTHHDPSLEPAIEITSSHGSFEWALRESIERGYKLGFLGGSDCYTGRPGDDRPGHQLRRYAKSGLTGIYTNDVTLTGFFEAMRARRVYATTGARIAVRVQADDRFMGEEYSTPTPPTLSVAVAGTAPLESVEIFRGLDRVHSFPIQTKAIPRRVRIVWEGASRMTSYSGVIWDGLVTLDGGTLQSAETLRFDSPRSHIVEQTENSLRWHVWGCGYPMGLMLDLEGDDVQLQIAIGSQTITSPMYGGHGEAGPPRRISFAPADRLQLSVSLNELASGPVEFPIGVLDRKLTVSLVTEAGPDRVDFQFTDQAPKPGINPYWVRVVQSDLEMAWTSPVFVDFVSSTKDTKGH